MASLRKHRRRGGLHIGPTYQKRYWKKSYFDAADVIKAACERNGIGIIEAVYRWLAYHSMLNERRGEHPGRSV